MSKNDIGDLNMAFAIFSCSFLDAYHMSETSQFKIPRGSKKLSGY